MQCRSRAPVQIVRVVARWTVPVWGLLLLTATGGCHSHNPYGYGRGYGTCYPGVAGPVYPQPGPVADPYGGQFIGPGQPAGYGPGVYPGGALPPGSGLGPGTTVPPGGVWPGPIGSNTGGGDNWPTPATDVTTEVPSGKGLPPRPRDPGGSSDFSDGGDGFRNPPATKSGARPSGRDMPDAFKEDDSFPQGSRNSTGNSSSSGPGPRTGSLTDDRPDVSTSLGSEDFNESGKAPGRVNPTSHTTESPKVLGANPYAHDPSGNWDWLRGVVSFDPVRKEYSVQFAARPGDDPTYGGRLTLANDDVLRDIRDGRVYYLEGLLDDEIADFTGKPTYYLRSKLLLRPRGAQNGLGPNADEFDELGQ